MATYSVFLQISNKQRSKKMEIKKAIHLLNVIVGFVDETAFKFVFKENEPFLSDRVLSWSRGGGGKLELVGGIALFDQEKRLLEKYLRL